jgi:hypothetical protein
LSDLIFRRIETQITNIQFHLVTSAGVETPHPPGTEPLGSIGGTLTARFRFVDADGPTVQLALIHFGYGGLGGGTGGECYETEPARTGGAPFHGEEDVGDGTEFAEYLAEAGFVGCIIQIPHIQFDFISGSFASFSAIGGTSTVITAIFILHVFVIISTATVGTAVAASGTVG